MMEAPKMEAPKSKTKLGLFALTMIAIVSVDSLRNLPISAQYGASLITFYVIAAVCFFLPLAYIASKLSVLHPNTGGSYLWIEKAFGPSFGYISILLQWVYNMIWYPTIFAFINSVVAYLFFPSLEHNKWFILLSSLVAFWGLSLIHCLGLRASSLISNIGAIVGTLIPMMLIIALATFWLIDGNPSATPLTAASLLPDEHSLHNLAFFSNILFSLLGLEVIAMHAGNVGNPSKIFPKAFFMSAILILATIMFSSLSLCIIMPSEKIPLINGIMGVFEAFFGVYHFPGGSLLMGACIVIGGLAIAASWMIGLARGLHVAICSADAPAWLKRTNKNQMPANVLLLQAVIYTVILSVFLIFPDINSSYWILSALTAQFALLYYILLFAAGMKLLHQKQTRPLSRILCLVLPCVASLVCMLGILVGFTPPEDLAIGSKATYEFWMIGCFIVVALLPLVLPKRKKVAMPDTGSFQALPGHAKSASPGYD